MKIAKIIVTSVFGIASVILAYMLFDSIMSEVELTKSIEKQENAIKAKLIQIRKAQVAYNTLYGQYCDDWTSLTNFIKDSNLVVIDKKEEIHQISYEVNGTTITMDSTSFIIDTINIVKVQDSLYNNVDFEIEKIALVPNTSENFELKTRLEGVVAYIEIKDAAPINPERQKHGKLDPLKSGSLEKSTIKGNWEKK